MYKKVVFWLARNFQTFAPCILCSGSDLFLACQPVWLGAYVVYGCTLNMYTISNDVNMSMSIMLVS
jgi:hypothetical protein